MSNPKVVMAKVDTKLAREHYEQLFGHASEEPLKKVIADIQAHYTSASKSGMDLATCGTCQLSSDHNLDKCPVCGAGEVEMEGALLAADKPPKADKLTTKYTVADLEKEITGFFATQADATKSYWGLGIRLKKIRDEKLWCLRLSADALPQYSSFEKFVKAEIGWSAETARKSILICERFSEKDIEKLGRTKLGMILSLPVDQQDEAKNNADGKSTRLLGEEKAESTTPRVNTTTVILPDEKIVVKLFAKKQPAGGGEPTVLAKSIEDKAWGKIQSKNGVELMVALRKTSGGALELVFDIARDD